MTLALDQNNILLDIFTKLDQKDCLEARNNLLGFFETLIEIDQRLCVKPLVKSENLSNNKLKEN